jgi:hypothetical protein
MPAGKIPYQKCGYFNMGIRLRIFIVNDDDTLQRLPLARYDQQLGRNPKECIPEYEGARRIILM